MSSSSGLQDIAEKTVISNLGEVAKTFSCGGSLPQVDNVTIYYIQKTGGYNALTLPLDVMEDKNLTEFLEACSTASFGQTVTDALKLDPDCFSANFVFSQHSNSWLHYYHHGCSVIHPSRTVQTECLLDWWSLQGSCRHTSISRDVWKPGVESPLPVYRRCSSDQAPGTHNDV